MHPRLVKEKHAHTHAHMHTRMHGGGFEKGGRGAPGVAGINMYAHT